MTPAALLSEAVTSLRLNVFRSALTAIGVIIGVAGIIVLGAAAAAQTRSSSSRSINGRRHANYRPHRSKMPVTGARSLY